jgi:multiple sugar transport system permease protein
MLDGYSRMKILFKIILPQAMTGIIATAVFCLIAAWNEYAFALSLTSETAVTMPLNIANAAQENTITHGRVAAGAVLFMLPIAIFTLLMRKHLLRGVTFGAVKG